jgi:hypothetical protein
MFPLLIRLKKNADGSSAQSCTRTDGSVTWQRLREGQAAFFTRHDLTHVAVESVLRHRKGFYGLVAAGWNFSDFTSEWPRGRIPADADPSELLVGLLDAEHASGTSWTAAEFNAHAARFFANLGAASPPVLTEEQLQRVRDELSDLLARWQAVPPGEALELAFDPVAKKQRR